MDKPPVVYNIVPFAESLTAVILAMLFVCLIFPRIVKNQRQFYAAVGSVCMIVLLYTLNVMIHNEKFSILAGVFVGVAQLLAIVMIVMSVHGLSAKDFAGDVGRAYEVMRRGEDEKEIIIPLSSQPGAPIVNAPVVKDEDLERKVYSIDEKGNS